MIRTFVRFIALGVALLFPVATTAQTRIALPPPKTDSAVLGALETRYFTEQFAAEPTSATGAGLHADDDKLPDYSAAAYARRIARSQRWLAELAKLKTASFSMDDRADIAIMRASLETELLLDRDLEQWRHNPSRYTSIAS